MPLVASDPGERYRQLPQAWAPLAIYAVTAALLTDKTVPMPRPHYPPPPDQAPPETPGMEVRRCRHAGLLRRASSVIFWTQWRAPGLLGESIAGHDTQACEPGGGAP